jgi:hypothetical protein
LWHGGLQTTEGFAMRVSDNERDSVRSFANDWIMQNIETGPFSLDDVPRYEAPIRQFRKEAAKAGFDEGQLERVVGPVPTFVSDAFETAAIAWRANQKRRPPVM